MKKISIILLIFLLLIPLCVWAVEGLKPLPKGISFEGPRRRGRVGFLRDLTYKDKKGNKIVSHEIFPEIFRVIDQAQDFLLLDFFLYNDDYDRSEKSQYPKLSQELTQALLKKKKQNPDLVIICITDPINSMYNSYEPQGFARLKEAGIVVITTDLDKIRDPNPLYSNLYRAYFKWVPHAKEGRLPNLFDRDKPKASLASYLSLLNFKANHRKVIVSEKEAIVSSANPHDASYYHSNIAFWMEGEIVQDIIASEKALIKLSGADISQLQGFEAKGDTSGPMEVQLVTEAKIKKHLLKTINRAGKGDQLRLGIFYLSHRDLIKALKEASDRGVKIQIILDVNKDAFGKKKIGIPNKPVARELSQKKNITLRWYQTQGEQFHAKFLIYQGKGEMVVIGGSANFTRRNLDDYNLETDLVVYGKKEDPFMQEILSYYDSIWNNRDGVYTSPYQAHKEKKIWKEILYRIQEVTGLSTF